MNKLEHKDFMELLILAKDYLSWIKVIEKQISNLDGYLDAMKKVPDHDMAKTNKYVARNKLYYRSLLAKVKEFVEDEGEWEEKIDFGLVEEEADA